MKNMKCVLCVREKNSQFKLLYYLNEHGNGKKKIINFLDWLEWKASEKK